jgi:hypothetical protein
MGEVDHADDTVDHGVSDGDQPVDRAERDAVEQLLDQDLDVHGEPRSSLRAWRSQPDVCVRLVPASLSSRERGFPCRRRCGGQVGILAWVRIREAGIRDDAAANSSAGRKGAVCVLIAKCVFGDFSRLRQKRGIGY